MLVGRELLISLGASAANADRYLAALNEQMARHEVATTLRMAHFLAQVFHESARLRLSEENLNYSAEGLRKTFPKYFSSVEAAIPYARQPERIANRVYGGRLGNGNEASGDGYRYRGRGLIQLTGKSNYRSFAQWLGVDVVASPDLVAGPYAVHSALYYWSSHGLNAFADIDDLETITRRINGGLNGYGDRLDLLLQAKDLLAAAPARPQVETPVTVLQPTHRVKATQLNLRSEPVVAPRTWLALLNEGTEVEVLEAAGKPGWVKVRVALNDLVREGVLSSSYLEALPARPTPAAPVAAVAKLAAAHMEENRSDITRKRDGGRAYPLGEARRPGRAGDDAAARARSVSAIADYLDVGNPAHLRYQPRGGATYCNIYAADFAYLCGVYLPRVWWTDAALLRIQAGEKIAVEYGSSVRELNANALFHWLEDFGSAFGWERELELTALQAAANRGEVCVIVACRRDLNRSGHISVVLPETATAAAVRNQNAEVLRPLESQAGTRNATRAASASAWWQHSRYLAYALWRHP